MTPDRRDRALVLVVEDDPQVNRSIRSCLASEYRTEHAFNGREALQKALELRPDLILSDVMMPELRGDDLVTEIRGRHELDLTPILLLTGKLSDELLVRVLRSGAQDCLAKPFSVEELRARVENLVRAKQVSEKNQLLNAELSEKNARLEQLTLELRAKNLDLQDDLKLAREVQQAFLPHRYPAFAEGGNQGLASLRFCHRYVPAGIVGGDFLDVLAASPEEAAIVVCDVMGHGVRAALVTAMLRAVVGEHGEEAGHPGWMLEQINRALRAVLRETEAPLFVTACYLVANARDGEVRYAIAGHPSPLIVHGSQGVVVPLQARQEGNAPPLGMAETAAFKTGRCRLERGDRLLVFTDGAYEVEGAGGQFYGQQRLRETLLAGAKKPADQLLDEILVDLRRFSINGELSDDACLLALDFGAESSVNLP
jgi:sigma-B regulation protein RsbU (phosphoserine phosphatase)